MPSSVMLSAASLITVVEKKCLENFFKTFVTFVSLLIACITSSLNQENTPLLQGSGPSVQSYQMLLLSYSTH